MRILKSRHRNAEEFLASHLQPAGAGGGPGGAGTGAAAGFDAGGVFYPTREAIPVGENVLVEISFPELADKMLLRGFVAWRRPGRHRQKIRAGLGVEFLPTEKLKNDYLVDVARGQRAGGISLRRHRRLPVAMPVTWRTMEERRTAPATLDDIGPGGAFVRTDEMRPMGTSVVLEVLPPGAQIPLSIEGRVAWHFQGVTGAGTEFRGFGVEFRVRDTGGIRRIKEIVRRLESTESAA